ncbi:MAG: AsmA-like C-terminal region-containing protein, partial [Rickettsiales bacterium]|nr:AsmA-like C-terminal region-containing protein [Rickettsiales bacterium]
MSTNVKSTIALSNIESYDANINIERKINNNEIATFELKVSKRNDLLNITGDIDIKSNNIEDFIRKTIPALPNLKITNGPAKLSSKIQFSQNILKMSDIQLVYGNTFGTGNFDYDMNNETKNLTLDFSYLEAPNNIATKSEFTDFIKQSMTELKGIDIDLSIDSLKTRNSEFQNINLSIGMPASNSNSVDIKNFTIESNEISGQASGILSVENNNLIVDLQLSSETNSTYKLGGLKPFIINSFDGIIKGSENNFDITINQAQTSIGNISGTILKETLSGKKLYDINISSDNTDIDELLSGNIFTSLKNKINFLNNAEINFKINSNRLIYQNSPLTAFIFYGNFSENNVDISQLNFSEENYTVAIKGKLNNITDKSGSMDNVSYEIKSFDFTNIRTGYMSQIPFLYNLLRGEAGTISFTLNGPANNPKMIINGTTTNMDLSANISSVQKNKIDITTNILHKDAKLLINKIYEGNYDFAEKTLKENIGEISFQTNITSDKSNIVFDDINAQVAGQNFGGKIIIDKKGIITANINSENLNLTQLIKNSNDNYKQNALIYLLNTANLNINIAARNLTTYSRTYTNAEFGINRFSSNPSFSLKANFDTNASITINGKISGGNTYSGTLKTSLIPITEAFFGISGFDILSGYLNTEVNFSTFGNDKSELILNLNGNAITEFTNGRLSGFSSKSDIERKIYSSPTMITNDVIDIIETSLSSGESDFTSVKINGYIENGAIREGIINAQSEDLSLIGNLTTSDLTAKSISFTGTASISNILPDPMQSIYNIKGFSQNLQKEISLENIISKVNSTYFQMKKKEYLAKNGLTSINNNTNRPSMFPPFMNRPTTPNFPG